MMKERPILFSAPMVCAIINGRKTQTRRTANFGNREIAKVSTNAEFRSQSPHPLAVDRGGLFHYLRTNENEVLGFSCPYGKPGDRLWVREQFSGPWTWNEIPPSGWGWDKSDVPIWYWADGNPQEGDWTRPKPSIHMPRRYSRITLGITDVRLQWLQEISEEDACAEGVTLIDEVCGIYREDWHSLAAFERLWDSINSKRAPWDSNPLVWAISFSRVVK